MADAGSHEAYNLGAHIQRGDMAPWWKQGIHKFAFDPAAGRYIALIFFGTTADPIGEAVLHAAEENARNLEGKACFFAVGADSLDWQMRVVRGRFPALFFLPDLDNEVNRAYGIGPGRVWLVLDPMLRVIEARSFGGNDAGAEEMFALIKRLPPPASFLGFQAPAPVLILPDVFEPHFCRHLIAVYEREGGRESGFMHQAAHRAEEMFDAKWKRRRDHWISDKGLIDAVKARISRRVILPVQRVFQFRISRIERHLIACYAAEDGAHFGPHRDDTIPATEHRRFALSINLNEDFTGGEVSFPEYSDRTFKAPIGAALVFSAAILHRVSRVIAGRRYAFLPFAHDEEAEKVRITHLPKETQDIGE